MVGGGERALFDLATGLARGAAFSPVVLCRQSGPLVHALRQAGVDTTVLPFPDRFRRGFWPVFSLLALAQVGRWRGRSGAALVHSNGPFGLLYGGGAARLRRLPVVHTCHLPDDLSSAGKRVLLRIVPQRTLAVSEALARRLRDELGLAEQRALHVPLGIETMISPDVVEKGRALRRGQGWGPDCVVFGQVARWQPVKGQARFLDALDILCRRRTDVRAVLVGPSVSPGSPEAAWRQMVVERIGRSQALGDGRVVVAEGSDEATVAAWMAAMDGLVVPSDAESFGRVVLEAMAHGRPVIATPCDGPVEILEQGVTGWLTPTWDPSDLAGAMERLAGDRETGRAMGRQGRDVCGARCEVARPVQAVGAVYGGLLDHGG